MRGLKQRIVVFTITALTVAAAVFTFPASSQDQGRPGDATSPIAIDDQLEIWLHTRTGHTEIRGSQPYEFGNSHGVALSVVVAPDGHVVSAEATGGDKDLFDRAERAARGWTYLPFERDGRPIFARIEESIQLLPPERRRAAYVPPPDIKNWNSLRITLWRTGCFGTCPAYGVEIRGDGTVIYKGEAHVAVGGRHTGHIAPETVRGLFAKFRAAEFFSTLDEYRFNVSDGATYKLAIRYDGVSKSMTDYAGNWAGMPGAISDLERAIDQAAGTLKWIIITSQTVPSLVTENYFKSGERDTSILATMIVAGATSHSVRELIGLGASLSSRDSYARSPLAAAAYKGDIEITRILLDAGAGKNDRRQMSEALFAAAENGSIELARTFIQRCANPNFTSEGITPLMVASDGGVPEIVEALLSAGARVNTRDDEGATAVIYASRGDDSSDSYKPNKSTIDRGRTVRLLVDAGANPSECYATTTPLMESRASVEATRALIERGADANKRCESDGWTALQASLDSHVTKMLLEAGADPLAQQRGRAIVDDICRYPDDEKCIIVKQWISEHPKPTGR
jgi:hypothetical protein